MLPGTLWHFPQLYGILRKRRTEGGDSMAFVDIHHHLLNGMDDGPAEFEETKRMLHRAVVEGVEHIAATPHMTPGMEHFDRDKYQERLAAVREYVAQEGLPLTIHAGVEVFYTAFTVSYLRQNKIMPLGNGWHVLVEFHPSERYEAIRDAAMNISNAGYSMVLAHAERYRALRRGDRLTELRNAYDVKVQMNAAAILRAHQRWGDRWIRRMLKDGKVDIVSSDAHNTTMRPCLMGSCAELLSTTYGEDMARQLCTEQAQKILHERENA